MSASKPKIAWNNLLELGTVVASTEAAGFEKENAYDGLTHDAWKPSATGLSTLTLYLADEAEVDCVAIAAHNLFTNGGTFKLQHSDDGVTYTDCHSVITPTHNGPIMKVFTPVTKGVLKFCLTSNPASYIGAIFIGKALDLERGVRSFQVPKLGREVVTLDSESQGGQFLGRSVIRQGAKSVLSLSNLTGAWVRTYWDPFMQYAQTKPFFLSWDNGDHEDEAAFCKATKPIKTPYNDNLLMDSVVEMDCIVAPVTPRATSIPAVPPVPSGLVASPHEGDHAKLDLEWDAVALPGITYSIYRRLTTGGTSTLITTISGTTYTDTGRSADTEYFYVVKANNIAGSSAYSAEASATTVLSAVTGVVTETQADGSIQITWDAKAGATGYNIYKTLPTPGLVGTLVAPTVTINHATPPALEYYIVAPYNANGEGTPAAQELGAVPVVPGAAVATPAGGGDVDVDWADVANVDDYNVYVSVNGGAYVFASGAPFSGTGDTGTPGETRTYKITSKRDLYESAQGPASNTVTVT